MFEVGVQVQLASGGPIMTVSAVIDEKTVECQWFDTKQELQVRNFVLLTLQKYEEVSVW
ncbi:YodC family protein [Vibrio splendidus]|uniref:DUF2158 domain-containing protein n=2 Tax=Vibrio splendidus TaxID=29497 RepID=A0A2T5DW20_VIBSP|nr:DUF2158 domain-containing protein [Vibrio splendidus]PTP07701.1 DUF2158 domain-containing protein [Vibrio splendidus]